MNEAGVSVGFDTSAWGWSPWNIALIIVLLIAFAVVMRSIRRRAKRK